jgi:ABC-type uncharacterized transport system involved in gliding motility auxiliary subunit
VQKSLLSVAGILVLGGILLLINAISDTLFSRFYVDLTEERLYSLSPGTTNVLKILEEPLTFRFYFSKTEGSKYAGIKLYGTRIADLLREYERRGHGKISLEIYDPRPDSEEEEWAEKYGITPLSLPTGEKLYLGLAAVNAVGEEDSIPVFDLGRQEFLEYDITKLVYSLNKAKKPILGIISSLNLKGEQDKPTMPGKPPSGARPWILINQLSKFADVKFLPSDTDAVSDNIDVLMVIHPKNLSDQTLYAIDQYAVKGGRLFVAVDPYSAVDTPKTDPNNPFAAMMAERSSNMKKLLSTWGVNLIEKQVVGDINLATTVATGQDRQQQVFPVWLTLGGDAKAKQSLVDRDNVITSQLDNVMFAWSGALELSNVEGLTMEPLFRTTQEAMLYPEQDIRLSGDNPDELLKKYRRGNQAYVLGVRVSGKLKSSFPNKPGSEPSEQNQSAADGHIAQGTKETNVIVVADVDFLADQYTAYVQQFFGTQLVTLINDNLVFAANAVENLAGSNDLISLRSRGKFTRPFTKVQAIEGRAQEKWKQGESEFQAELNQANQRLSQLQSGTGGGKEGKKLFTAALLNEIKTLREQRAEAQRRLREVRRMLREDKEHLGLILFLLNTFLVPLILIVGSIVIYCRKGKGSRAGESSEKQRDQIVEEANA